MIRTTDEDGQFEVLVRKTATLGIDATACRSPWLLVRMPAVLPPVGADYHPKPRDPANQHLLEAAKAEYAALVADAAAGRPSTFRVNGASYATKTRQGLRLSGCNLFFTAGEGMRGPSTVDGITSRLPRRGSMPPPSWCRSSDPH